MYISPLSSQGSGAVWTKLSEDGFADGEWAVDRLIRNKGKHDVVVPKSLAAGEYLLRAEIIALHEGDTNFLVNPARGAQFYPSCAQIRVVGGGKVKLQGGFDFVGGYTPTDPGILFNIYTTVKEYPIPGPPVWNGELGGGPVPTTSLRVTATTKVVTPTTLVTSVRAPSASSTPAPGAEAVKKYGQCGGINYVGSKTCEAGSKCTELNPYYFQCL